MIRGSLAGHAGVPMRRAPSLIKLYVNFQQALKIKVIN